MDEYVMKIYVQGQQQIKILERCRFLSYVPFSQLTNVDTFGALPVQIPSPRGSKNSQMDPTAG